MAEHSQNAGVPPAPSASDHLSVRVYGPNDLMFGSVVGHRGGRTAVAMLASIVLDIAVFALFALMTRYGYQTYRQAQLPDDPNEHIVWLTQPGPGGGGGGGGNKMPDPPKPAQLPGKEKITVPAAPPPVIEPKVEPKVEPPPIEPVNIPAKTLASATESLPGAIEVPSAVVTQSQGSGNGGGAGSGAGKGVGSGTGSGLGPGSGGGTGGGVFRPGNGVTAPQIIYKEKINYTPEAMRARIQGTVWVSCIVQSNGQVTDARVIRSLDPVFGLDEEALRSVRLWRFTPGKRFNEAVPVEITVELAFALR